MVGLTVNDYLYLRSLLPAFRHVSKLNPPCTSATSTASASASASASTNHKTDGATADSKAEVPLTAVASAERGGAAAAGDLKAEAELKWPGVKSAR